MDTDTKMIMSRPGRFQPCPETTVQPDTALLYEPHDARLLRPDGSHPAALTSAHAGLDVSSGLPGLPCHACACRKPDPCHATRRYSLIRPPTRVCLRTRYWSRSTGSGSGFSG